jgi:predicted GNAT family acetyltransferase
MKKPLTFRCLEAITTTVGALEELDARAITSSLTRAGSEFQQEVMNRDGSRTPITIIREGSWRIAAWAASHQWRGLQTIEGFTHPDFRRRGCCRAAVAMLVAAEALDPSQPVAVFSVNCLGLAQSLGFTDIRLYKLFGDDWRLVLEHKPLRWSPPGGAGE